MKNRIRYGVSRFNPVAGFTLIELLTVIAIIAILAGLLAVAVPQYLSKARETRTVANMDTVSKALMEYSARTGNTTGYPAAYGYVKAEAREVPVANLLLDPVANYVLRPYTIEIGIHGEEGVYQDVGYASSHDMNIPTNGLSLFEYLPIGLKDVASGQYTFSDELYQLTSPTPMIGAFNEVNEQLVSQRPRPFVYVPFNSRQLAAVRNFWISSGDEYGVNFDNTNPEFSKVQGRLFFPPPQYDSFVLIGNGPGGTNGGLADADPPGTPGTDYDQEYTYHMLGLRIAFLATRDLDDDKKLDFEYRDRKSATTPHTLPDGTNGQGAFILAVQ